MTLVPERFEDWFWTRHSNPKSGWSRVPAGPVIVYAVYRRNWRLLAVMLLWTALNPFLFAPPDHDEAWMTRAVLAERWWVREQGNGTVGVTYPNVCNAGSAVAAVYALAAAVWRRPAGAALGTTLMAGLKLWWLRAIVREYDAREG